MTRGRQLVPFRQRHSTTPLPPVEIPDKPDGLDEIASAEWDRICALLHSEGLISRLDRAIIQIYVMTFSRLHEANKQLLATGGEVVVNASGTPVTNPWATIRDRAAKQLLELGRELGLSTASRTKIKLPGWARPEELTPDQKRKARFFSGTVAYRQRYPDAIDVKPQEPQEADE